MPGRRAEEIMVARGQVVLAAYYQKKYNMETKGTEYNTLLSDFVQCMRKRSFRTAIQWAAYSGLESVVDFLLGYVHAGGGKYEWSALHYAALAGQISVIELLLRHGVYMNALDVQGRTPLHILVHQGELVVALALLAHGAKMDVHNVLDSREGQWVKVYLDPQCSHLEFDRAVDIYLSEKFSYQFLTLRLYHNSLSAGSQNVRCHCHWNLPGPWSLSLWT